MELLKIVSIDSFFEWLQDLISPLSLMRSAFELAKREDAKAVFKRYWATPIVLATIVNLVVIFLFPEMFVGLQFYIVCMLVYLIGLFISALAIDLMCRVCRIQFQFKYSIASLSIFSTYFPIISLLSSGAQYENYKLLLEIMHLHLDPITSISIVGTNLTKIANMLLNLKNHGWMLSYPVSVLGLFLETLLAEAICLATGIRRFAIYAVAALSSFVFGLLFTAMNIVIYFLLLEFGKV